MKRGSIWDYPKPGLDPDVWDEEGKLYNGHKKMILSHLYGALIGFGFKNFEEWIKDIVIIGSLTSYQYSRFSDLDVHIIIDVDKFMEAEGLNKVSPERLLEYLNEDLRKFLNVKAQIKLDKTEHPVEYYFESEEVVPASKDEGVYSLFTDTWIRPPRTLDLDFNPDVYYGERKKVIEEFVREFDIKVMDINRLVKDVDFLQETLEQMPEVAKKKWKKYLDEKIKVIEEEIKDLIQKTDEVIKARREEYERESDVNLLFKFLQRYQYIWLAKQLEKALELEKEEMIEKVKDILVEFPYRTGRGES
jgi:predicted nucleotidyltransferase